MILQSENRFSYVSLHNLDSDAVFFNLQWHWTNAYIAYPQCKWNLKKNKRENQIQKHLFSPQNKMRVVIEYYQYICFYWSQFYHGMNMALPFEWVLANFMLLIFWKLELNQNFVIIFFILVLQDSIILK